MKSAETITEEAYKQALLSLDIEGKISENQRVWLKTHYDEGVVTTRKLAQVVGYKTYHPVNRWYGELGKLVAEKVGYTPPEKYTWLSTLVTFDKESSPYPMRLRPNVIEALKGIEWV